MESYYCSRLTEPSHDQHPCSVLYSDRGHALGDEEALLARLAGPLPRWLMAGLAAGGGGGASTGTPLVSQDGRFRRKALRGAGRSLPSCAPCGGDAGAGFAAALLAPPGAPAASGPSGGSCSVRRGTHVHTLKQVAQPHAVLAVPLRRRRLPVASVYQAGLWQCFC